MSKLVIIGTGNVGATFAYSAQLSGMFTEIVLINEPPEVAHSEALDLNHALPFVSPVKIYAGTWKDCVGADVAVMTAGSGRRSGESRLDLITRNVSIVESICEKIRIHMEKTPIIVVSNPVDVMTYIVWQRTGFPRNQIIGSGTVLDTARFRYLLSNRMGVDPRNVHAHVIGEHGDSSVFLWDSMKVAGVSPENFVPGDSDLGLNFRQDVENTVRQSGAEVIAGKGCTIYGVSQAVLRISGAIIRNESSLLTVSVVLGGEFDLTAVSLSVPCILGDQGLKRILPWPLSQSEIDGLQASAKVIQDSLIPVAV
ncbi:MAG: L-lactate dehydrogenase [bacterium]|nr:L-lactate dehydrogenase [bacterium]